MTFWVRFLEISGNFHQEPDVYTTSFHHVFTTFHYIYTTFTPWIYTTWNFHNIFSLCFHHKFTPQRDEQTPWGHTDRFSLQIYTTNLHYEFSPHISLSWECDLGDKQTKISLETVVSSNILIHSSGNSVKKGCTDKFSPHGVKINKFTPHVVKILSCKSISFHHIMLISW